MLKTKLMSIAAAALAISVASAEAAPMISSPTATTTESEGAAVTTVQYRGHGWGGGWRGPGIGLGIGAGIVAGAIIADRAYAPRRGYYYDSADYDGPYYAPEGYSGDRRRLCAQNFRSFEWRTGMYTTYGGERRVCPYLN